MAPRSSTSPVLPTQPTPPGLALSGAAPLDVTDVEVVALPVVERPGADPLLGPGADAVAERLGLDLASLAAVEDGLAGPGRLLAVPVVDDALTSLRQVVLVGVGGATPAELRTAGAALARHARGRSVVATTLACCRPDDGDDDLAPGVEALTAGLVLGSFLFHWRSTTPDALPAGAVTLALLDARDKGLAAALARAEAVATASWRARFLATVPSNLKNPPWLAEQAREIGAAAGLTVRVWDEVDLEKGGFGGILGVGAASATPPRLVRLDYTPKGRGRRKAPTVVLVGKGITFDSGGLSIKPAEAMRTMKRDMTGGAVVLATMAALAAVDCPVRVVGLVAAAENAVGGASTRPGDVLRHYGGRTSEVTNTDAEGRLVMADALAYAVDELDPAVLVDVATLTGAVKVSLGQSLGGLFANDDALAGHLLAAGERSGEPLWRLPLASVYEDKLRSGVADADNAGGGPGAITAALFLQHFVAGRPWAHLDIASVGDAPEEREVWSKGPTGFGVRALLDWLGGADPLAGVGG